jgi:23S rRNA (adenine-N6)-dimethyltransferase
VSAGRWAHRAAQRRRLGQNFLGPELAERLVADADVRAGELVIEIGAGAGAITLALARRAAQVVAVELDPAWAERLGGRLRAAGHGDVRVVTADFLTLPLPDRPFRVVASPPFGRTTAILRRLFDDPAVPLVRADLVVQREVALKRATAPPDTLPSTAWAPWWEFRLGRAIAATEFRPVPAIDARVLVATRRSQPLLPASMANAWSGFVAAHWPFESKRSDQTVRRSHVTPSSR